MKSIMKKTPDPLEYLYDIPTDQEQWRDLFFSTVKLRGDTFIRQIIQYGYFAEQFPSCFQAVKFTESIDSLLPLVKTGGANLLATMPTTLSTYKNDISRRILSLPNPKTFLRLASFMKENWDDIQRIATSENSQSPITCITSYDFAEQEFLNSENVRESFRLKSDFIDGIKDCILVSLGYKYRLKLDIANCYNSIYTHSVSWAVCGKDIAKKYLLTKEPKSAQKIYELADALDEFMRYQKNNETNGIVVGPFTSRIFSEIILAAIDHKLSERGYVFRRYVDDYKFYFRTEAQAQESVPNIEKILNEFNLNLNIAKTEITRYPFEVIASIKTDFEDVIKTEGVFGVLNTATQLFLNGEKGAYKYALKFINNKEPHTDDFSLVIASLLNIMLLDPKLGKYVVAYLQNHSNTWNKEKLDNIVNRELNSSLSNELQEEALLFIQIIKELKLNLTGENLIAILKSQNDFALVIALDIWKNRNKSVVRTRTEAREITSAINNFSSTLAGESYHGSRWFLLHELKMHQLLNDVLMPKPKYDAFFTKLCDCKVTFYNGLR
ncbi:hypothetical protein AGMMS50230_20860 [Spirochaetia bacterium]|nr:hypothetical protein AGMMS50230_20860 [Spirochaetia bacterium]